MYLGGMENRCKGYKACPLPFRIDDCVHMALLPQTPYAITVHGGAKDVSAPATDWEDRSLPFCSNGNHPGRWLTLPASVTAWCESTSPAHQKQHSQEWNNLLAVPKGASAEVRTYYRELLLYLNGDICSMVAPITDSTLPRTQFQESEAKASALGIAPESRHAVFAPYSCKYKLYWIEETRQCLGRGHISPLFLTGDSMTRDLYVKFLNAIQFSTMTSAEAKLKTNVKKDVKFYFRKGNVTIDFILHNVWEGEGFHKTARSPIVRNAKAIVTDFAFLHNQNADVFRFEARLRASPVFKLWHEHFRNDTIAASSSGKLTLKIWQTASNYQSLMTDMRTAEIARRLDGVVGHIAREEFGFKHELNLNLFGAAQLELRDGLHLFNLNQLMEFMILVNMLCHHP